MTGRKCLKLNIKDIFITFAYCYKPRVQVNGKEKDPLHSSGNYSLLTGK